MEDFIEDDDDSRSQDEYEPSDDVRCAVCRRASLSGFRAVSTLTPCITGHNDTQTGMEGLPKGNPLADYRAAASAAQADLNRAICAMHTVVNGLGPSSRSSCAPSPPRLPAYSRRDVSHQSSSIASEVCQSSQRRFVESGPVGRGLEEHYYRQGSTSASSHTQVEGRARNCHVLGTS